MTDIATYSNMIEFAIQNYDEHIDINKCRTDTEGLWVYKEENTSIYFNLFKNDNDMIIFHCSTPLVTIPEEDKTNFYKKILELNQELSDVYLNKDENEIAIGLIRNAEGLDGIEVYNYGLKLMIYAENCKAYL